MSSLDKLDKIDNTEKTNPNQWSAPATVLIGLAGFIIANAISFVIVIISLKFLKSGFEKDIYFNFGLLVITDITFLLVIFWYLKSIGLSIKSLGFIQKLKASGLLMILPALAGYVILTASISLLFKLAFPGIDLGQEQAIAFKKAVGPLEQVFAAVALLVIAPVSEELIFRGFVFRGFRKQFGFLSAAVVSSIFFGLVHGQINVALDTFALGLMLCFLYEKTQSIWPSIILHSLKNGIAFYLLFFTSISAIW